MTESARHIMIILCFFLNIFLIGTTLVHHLHIYKFIFRHINVKRNHHSHLHRAISFVSSTSPNIVSLPLYDLCDHETFCFEY